MTDTFTSHSPPSNQLLGLEFAPLEHGSVTQLLPQVSSACAQLSCTNPSASHTEGFCQNPFQNTNSKIQ